MLVGLDDNKCSILSISVVKWMFMIAYECVWCVWKYEKW